MSAWRGMAAVLCAVLVSGCSLVPGFSGDPSQVGPAFALGPVPTFGPDAGEAGDLVFYETREGWCSEFDNGKMCAASSGPDGAALPEGFPGVGGAESPDGTCVETITGNDVVRLDVALGDAAAVTLRPLGGSEDAPVNAFAACWDQRIKVDDIDARAFDAAGNRVPGH